MHVLCCLVHEDEDDVHLGKYDDGGGGRKEPPPPPPAPCPPSVFVHGWPVECHTFVQLQLLDFCLSTFTTLMGEENAVIL